MKAEELTIDEVTGLPTEFTAAAKLGDKGLNFGLVADLRQEGRIDIWAVVADNPEESDADKRVWSAVKLLAECPCVDGSYAANMPPCWDAAGKQQLSLLLFVGENECPTINWPEGVS